MEERVPLLNTTRVRIAPSEASECDAGDVAADAGDYLFGDIRDKIAAQRAAEARHREKVEHLWGEPYEREHSREEDAGVVSMLLYNWVESRIHDAAKGSLGTSKKPLPMWDEDTTWTLGRRMSARFQRELSRRHAWDPFLGQPVRLKDDPASRGTLRWVGYVQQSETPNDILVGIEWQHAPQRRRRTPGALHDGTVYGEQLFAAPAGTASIERPDNVRFMYVYTQRPGETTTLTAGRVPRAPSVFRALMDVFRRIIAIQVLPKLVGDAAQLTQPMLLGYFVDFLSSDDPTWETGLLIVMGMFVVGVTQSLAQHKYYHMGIRSGLQFRSALQGLIFEKCFTISAKAAAVPEMSVGRVINMMSGDVERANDLGWYMMYLWAAPLQGVVALGLLYRLVGWAAFVGIAAMVFLAPLQGMIARRQQQTRQRLTTATDRRLKATNELFSGIRIVKLMGWEDKFVETVEERRAVEISVLRQLQYYRIASTFIVSSTPMIMIAATFVTYHLAGHSLTPRIVFPAISLLAILRVPFMMFPSLIATLIAFFVSMRRIAKFLESDPAAEVIQRIPDATDALKLNTNGYGAAAKVPQDWIVGDEHLGDPAGWSLVLRGLTVSAYLPVAVPTVVRAKAASWVSAAASAGRRVKNAVTSCCRSSDATAATAAASASTSSPSSPASGSAPTTPPAGKGEKGGKGKGGKGDDSEGFFVLSRKELLRDVSLRVRRGSFVVVVGPTGCGKSTLLESLLGQLEITRGDAWCVSSIAYAPQQPWIMSASVRDNITFYEEFDEARFQEAVRCSQLEPDIAIMPNGVDTEIGERGVSLSGGQKARLSLARSVYARRSLYLLDDVLAACDVHVQEKLVEQCFLGALAGTTRILATHQMHVVPRADMVVELTQDGTVAFTGTPEEFERYDRMRREDSAAGGGGGGMGSPLATTHSGMAASWNGEAAHASQTSAPGAATGAATADAESAPLLAGAAAADIADDADDADGVADDIIDDSDAVPKKPVDADAASEAQKKAEAEAAAVAAGKAHTVEEKAEGSVPMRVYWDYARACGGALSMVVLLIIFAITEVLNVAQSVWLSLWSTGAFGLERDVYLYVYIALVGLGSFSSPIRTMYAYSVLRRGSLSLHSQLLRSVATATMAFFDTTPLGRISNRFAKDIDQIDNELQMNIIFLLQVLFSMLSSLAVMITSQPFVLVALFPLGIIYYRVMLFFNAANREIQRVSNIAKSPVFALLTESLNGTRTILAYGKATRMMAEACRRVDVVFSANYLKNIANRWLGVRLELIGNCVVTSVALASVIGKMRSFGAQNVGLLSLGMTLALSVTSILNWIVRQAAAVEAEMNSIERVVFYTRNIDHEDFAEYGAPGKPLPALPARGSDVESTIEFRDVHLRYRPNLPTVLNGVTFSIRPREKVGFLGRTGSGKSTIMLALMRVMDPSAGEVIIGGVPARDLSLRDLRARFSMIAQDPLLFEGTVRSNLDPFGAYGGGDEPLLEALSHVGMRERVEKEGGLSSVVMEGGSNFSVGERQLLCAARALLKPNCPFILADEASANVSTESDAILQNAVKTAFADRTVLTIAHRLHTVIDCDRIFILDKGRIAESGPPLELAERRDSVFYSMIASHGEQQRKKLMRLVRSRKAAIAAAAAQQTQKPQQ